MISEVTNVEKEFEMFETLKFKGKEKKKGPRTKAPFTSHHPLPPKRSFNDQKLIDDWTVDSLHSYHAFHFRFCNGGLIIGQHRRLNLIAVIMYINKSF